jgi:glycosyltransferase involved in cell wall biosynthesis
MSELILDKQPGMGIERSRHGRGMPQPSKPDRARKQTTAEAPSAQVRATRYVVISPVRDEAATIRKTLDSMVSQSVRPVEWVIVDDGSTDQTPEIVREYARRFPWIRLHIRTNRGHRQPGAGVVEAFYDGLQQLRCCDYDFLVKLDGDLSFEPTYFEKLFERFAAEPRLGMASGNTYQLREGRLLLERTSPQHVVGPLKCYRRQCFEEIGGLIRHLGWDSADVVRAQMCGWQTKNYRDLVIVHHRPMGSAEGTWRGKVKTGQGDYFIGSHPLFEFVRCLYRAMDRPFLLHSVAIFWGYVSSWLRRAERIDDAEFIAFLRRQQRERLKSLLIVKPQSTPRMRKGREERIEQRAHYVSS